MWIDKIKSGGNQKKKVTATTTTTLTKTSILIRKKLVEFILFIALYEKREILKRNL